MKISNLVVIIIFAGIYLFRQQTNGTPLPGARKINVDLFLNSQWYDYNEFNVLLMQWGQFLAHDISLLRPDVSTAGYACYKYINIMIFI